MFGVLVCVLDRIHQHTSAVLFLYEEICMRSTFKSIFFFTFIVLARALEECRALLACASFEFYTSVTRYRTPRNTRQLRTSRRRRAEDRGGGTTSSSSKRRPPSPR